MNKNSRRTIQEQIKEHDILTCKENVEVNTDLYSLRMSRLCRNSIKRWYGLLSH